MVLAVVRCDCGGKIESGTEQAERGLRCTFTCQRCGSRWGHRDGVFRPLDRDSVLNGRLAPAELQLLACFRRLSKELQAEVVSQVRSLALSVAGVPSCPGGR